VKGGGTFALSGTWCNAGIIHLTVPTLPPSDLFAQADIGRIERTGGTVKLTGQLDNTGATLALNAQSGSWIQEGGTIKGGRLATSGGATLLGKSGSWAALTLESDISLRNGASLG